MTDPLSVPAGTHHVVAFPSGAPAGTAPVVDTTITLTPGEQATAGIGLGSDGKASLTLFDDAGLVQAAGGTALAVRGLAAAGAMRVDASDTVVTGTLTPGQQAVTRLAPGTYPVTVVPADGSDPAVPGQDVPLVAGRAVVLYLIGSQADNTLGWVAQTVTPGVAGAPVRVDTGVGPVLTVAGGTGTTLLVLGLPVGLLTLVPLRRRWSTAA